MEQHRSSGSPRSTSSSASVRSSAERPLRILTLTWNVGHEAPNPEEHHEWLPVRGEGYDLVIVATQELSLIHI